jgi:hypothetical protein
MKNAAVRLSLFAVRQRPVQHDLRNACQLGWWRRAKGEKRTANRE